jgi:hypothetical protein
MAIPIHHSLTNPAMIAVQMVNEKLTAIYLFRPKPFKNQWRRQLSFAFRKKRGAANRQNLPASVNFKS